MKKITFSIFLVLSSITTQLYGLDVGSMLKSAAPVLTSGVAQTPTVQNNSLVNSLTSSLGVTPAQAIGGTAVLLNGAKGKMQPTQYLELTNQTPGLGDILNNEAATSILGSTTPQSQFQTLGMDSSMIKQFAPIIIEYAKGYVSPGVASALSAALLF